VKCLILNQSVTTKFIAIKESHSRTQQSSNKSYSGSFFSGRVSRSL